MCDKIQIFLRAVSVCLTRSSSQAVALVLVDTVDTAPSVLARVALTLVNLLAADLTHVPWVTLACEHSNAVLTHAIVTGLWVTVIDVLRTQGTDETWWLRELIYEFLVCVCV